MTVDLTKLVGWYTSRLGTGTYSMEGSRNFSDGTADCSGSATSALWYAGCSSPAYLYSTVTLPSYLASNGFTRIAQNTSWDMLAGDVILWSEGADMAASAGAGGHVMIAVDADNEISTDVSRNGQPAVNEWNYDQYYSWNNPSYVEVWRYGSSQAANEQSGGKSTTIATTQTTKGQIEMYLVKTIDNTTGKDKNWYSVGAQGARYIKTVRVLNFLKDKLGLPVDTMYQQEFDNEFGQVQ